MVEVFRKLVDDKNIVKEFDLTKPENILKETIDSISQTVKQKQEQAAEPPRR